MSGKKADEVDDSNPYANLDKAAVIQECRSFNEVPLNSRKCIKILCKLLYLLQHGQKITKVEATDTFFAITKLFQSKSPTLRCLVYVAIKELYAISDDVIIVMSCLTKDMTGGNNTYRPSAIRALCRIIDADLLPTVERYIKQAIVDKAVSSAALVSSLHLFRRYPDSVRRWANEIQGVVATNEEMIQFHALSLLYHIRSNDKLAIIKLVQKYGKPAVLRSPLAICYMIRIAAKLFESERDQQAFAFVESCLRHKNEIVMYEAALAIVRLSEISSGDLASVIRVLQIFIISPKPSVRFAGVRTLNKIAMKYPQAVICCNAELEQLIVDQNRSIATLAITTLLITGSETSVERLMKQIGVFVTEISDEFKIVVISAVRSLCKRYPAKHETMMIFLTSMLRDEGNFEYKRALIDTIILIIEDNPDICESGLLNLCEFIEDCEYTNLSTRVLHFIGRQGPTTSQPEQFIRYIYNRIMLESTEVRTAAIATLAKFGAICLKLRPQIEVILKRCLMDSDDDIRDRATFYLALLRNGQADILSKYVLDALQVSATVLHRLLFDYMNSNHFEKPFDLKQVPKSDKPITSTEEQKPLIAEDLPVEKENVILSKNEIAEQLSSILDFADLGELFRSCAAVELSDVVSEYKVSCIKHVFQQHIVLQFDCQNTLNDQLLENVYIELTSLTDEEEEWKVLKTTSLDSLPFSQASTIYILLQMPETLTTAFLATLKFKIRDVDPETGEPESDEIYDDTFALENLSITLADHIEPIEKENFNNAWEQIGKENEVEETYALLEIHTIPDAVKKLQGCLGLAACEDSDKTTSGKSLHTLLMSGKYREGQEIVAQIKLALDPVERTVKMNIIVRSEDSTLSDLIANAVAYA